MATITSSLDRRHFLEASTLFGAVLGLSGLGLSFISGAMPSGESGSSSSGSLARNMHGIWWLQTREDWTRDNQKKIDPILGADPIGILCYADTHFAAQFMKRDRTDVVAGPTQAGKNNTAAVGGYDAYFGTYAVNEETGKVAHTLAGSINPANIGMTVERDLKVEGGKLTIRLETTTAEGEAVTRTLVWKRVG
jgi:hypothetical protein